MNNCDRKMTYRERDLINKKRKYAKNRLDNLLQLQTDLIKVLSETDFEKCEEAPKDINKMMKKLYESLSSIENQI